MSEVIFKMLVLEGLRLNDLEPSFQGGPSLPDTNMQLMNDLEASFQ